MQPLLLASSLGLVAAALASPPIAPGDLLALDACRDASFLQQQLIVRADDNTVRSADGSLCVTYTGPSPAQLAMQPCAAGAATQAWKYSAEKGGVFEAQVQEGCVAFNTQNGVLSSWPCSSEAWNGFFSVGAPFAGMIAANASAQQPAGMCLSAFGAGPQPCADDTDCTLAGTCNAATGVCSCFAPWTGADCGQLKFGTIASAGANGYGAWPLSSWGGNSIFYGGLYHLFVAEMVNNCTLEYWGQNSQCTHATSPNAEGPYTKVDTALGVWCHNPQVSYIPSENLWALWHIGDGTGSPANCNKSQAAVEASAPLAAPSAKGSPLHLASSPYGPWTPFTDWDLPNCNNPTQMRHPNGTWFLVCDSTHMYSGPNITGPFNFVMDIPTGPVRGTYEDGFLWIDKRGIWRQFFHVYTMTCDTPLCDPTAISGHSFSRDGLNWFRSPTQPYFTTANVSDGSVVQMSTRERPKLIFNADGDPTHLINGVDENPHCPPQAAIQCKVHGDHTQTLVVPIDNSQ